MIILIAFFSYSLLGMVLFCQDVSLLLIFFDNFPIFKINVVFRLVISVIW